MWVCCFMVTSASLLEARFICIICNLQATIIQVLFVSLCFVLFVICFARLRWTYASLLDSHVHSAFERLFLLVALDNTCIVCMHTILGSTQLGASLWECSRSWFENRGLKIQQMKRIAQDWGYHPQNFYSIICRSPFLKNHHFWKVFLSRMSTYYRIW